MFRDVLHCALDVGTAKICTLVGRRTGAGVIEVLGSGVAPAQGIKKGLVVNIQDAREAVRASLQEASRTAGFPITWAHVGVTGSHLEAHPRWGSIRAPHYSVPISYEDLYRAAEAAYPAEFPPERRVLHLLPRTYCLDGLKGIRNPVGMHALRLDVETLCIVGATTPIHNLVQAVERNQVRVRSLVLAPLAAAEAVLTADEREIGVILVDTGAGVTAVGVFQQGILWNMAILPVGGYQFTTDLSAALQVPYEAAEELKVKYAHAMPETVAPSTVEVHAYGDGSSMRADRQEIARVISERAVELLRLVFIQVRRNFALAITPPAGLVLAGGGASLPGVDILARRMFSVPVRIGLPHGVEGLPQELRQPAYATSVGTLLWGIRHHAQGEAGNGVRNGSWKGEASKAMSWLRERVRRVAL